MTYYRVLMKKIIAADGTVVAEAKSIAIASGTTENTVNQSASVQASFGAISSSHSASHSKSEAE